MNCYVDIETLPTGERIDPQTLQPPGNLKKAETIQAWYENDAPAIAEELFRKRALNSMEGRLLCVGFALESDAPMVIRTDEDEEAGLRAFQETLRASISEGDRISWVGHNALGFDMLWIWRRAVKYGLAWLVRRINLDRYKGNVEDTMLMWGGANAFQERARLEEIARFLGCGCKTSGIDGSKVYDFYQEGRIDEILTYCKQDVALTRAVYRRILGVRDAA